MSKTMSILDSAVIFALAFLVCTSNCSQDAISQAFDFLLKNIERDMMSQGDVDGLVQRRPQYASFKPPFNDANQYSVDYTPASPTSPQVKIKSGVVIGSTLSQSHAFYSIPYAKAPVGNLRFMPPQPVDSFTAPLNSSFPDFRMCYQVKNCSDGECNEFLMTEDCLVLNVNVPSTVDLSDPDKEPTDKLPVLFYIHGGFFFGGRGTTPKTDGRWLSEAANAIVVTINYRVGALGFLLFEENGKLIQGNQGFRDQQLALQWVQDNIGKFGGDKQKVTLFSNSAGGQSVEYHLLAPESKPLFRRSICESNPAVFPFPTQEMALTMTDRVMEAINCTDIVCLRNADAEAITYSRNEVMVRSLANGELFNGIEPFRPYLDGINFKGQHLDLFQQGKWHTDKEVIFGTNKDEMIFVTATVQAVLTTLPKPIFVAINKIILGEENGKIMSDAYLELAGDRPSKYDYSTIFGQEVTDLFFACPNRALARFASSTSTAAQVGGQVPVFLYDNAYPFEGEGCDADTDLEGVCGYAFHSSEILFVFKSADGYNLTFSENDTIASDIFTTYWSRFADAGNPNSESRPTLAAVAEWPSYASKGDNILIKVPESVVQSNYRKEFCDLWDATGFYVNITDAAGQSTNAVPATSVTDSVTNSATDSATTKQDKTTATTVSLDQENTTSDAVKLLFNRFSIFLFLYFTLSILI